eukprot:3941445-Rhodomonas_salina.1
MSGTLIRGYKSAMSCTTQAFPVLSSIAQLSCYGFARRCPVLASEIGLGVEGPVLVRLEAAAYYAVQWKNLLAFNAGPLSATVPAYAGSGTGYSTCLRERWYCLRERWY